MEESINATEEVNAIIDKIIENHEKTVIVEGVGKATSVGELDMKRFIEVAMGLPSFWK
jgi:D-arabinose 5-phosphate isomerase GutQ